MPKDKYRIGPKTFSTKKQIIEECQRIVAKYPDTVVIDDADEVAFLTGLVNQHEFADIKVGSGIKYFFVLGNQHGTRGFWLSRTDGTQTDFSYYQCTTPITHERRVKSAMRFAVKPQIAEFRSTLKFPFTCPLSGDTVDFGNCHIDHVIPFDELAGQFLCAVKLQLFADIEIPHALDGCTHYCFADPELESAWVAFHRERAVLRATSASGNLSRSR